MTFRRLVLACVVAIGLASCGPTPPQASLPAAKELAASTSGISSACGEAYQVREFDGGNRRELETLEATADSESHKLASVYAMNPEWIYQGQTVREIVHDAAVMLDACGLRQAGQVLTRG
jgi:hypothetical protein